MRPKTRPNKPSIAVRPSSQAWPSGPTAKPGHEAQRPALWPTGLSSSRVGAPRARVTLLPSSRDLLLFFSCLLHGPRQHLLLPSFLSRVWGAKSLAWPFLHSPFGIMAWHFTDLLCLAFSLCQATCLKTREQVHALHADLPFCSRESHALAGHMSCSHQLFFGSFPK